MNSLVSFSGKRIEITLEYVEIYRIIKLLMWPSGLERVSNSSRCSLEDPGFNPVCFGDFFFFVGQLHEDAPTEGHPGNLTILLP